jgi:hypothetical protein
MNFKKIYEDRSVFDDLIWIDVDYRGENKKEVFETLYDLVIDASLENLCISKIGDHAHISLSATVEALDKILPLLGYSKAEVKKLKNGEKL